MKRAGNLYPAICEPENLLLAFFKAAKGRHDRSEIIRFRSSLEDNLNTLCQQLVHEKIDIGHYRFFRIRDPKPRHICAAAFPERVLHHAIMNICEPVFERYAIFDSYACRKGKGSVRALHRAQHFMRSSNWYLKLDIRRYFDSIDHGVMRELLGRRIKDRSVLRLFSLLLDSYHYQPGKGLPIGNLASQHLSNLYLGYYDHWVKEVMRIRGYLRYMDDFVVFAQSRSQLKQIMTDTSEFLDHHLKLQLKEGVQINRCRFGMPFLGYRVYPYTIRLGVRAKKRFRLKFRQYEQKVIQGVWTEAEMLRRMEPLLGFIEVADSQALRKDVINRYGVLS